MNKQLLRSILSLSVLALVGGGVTYALFTSNTVSITSNSLTSGSAEIKLCDATVEEKWTNSLAGFSLSNLIPNAPEEELTEGKDILLGNDSGTLNNNHADDCTAYADGVTPGSSDTTLNIVPKVASTSCDEAALEDQLELQFSVGGTLSAWQSLSLWEANTASVGSSLAPDADIPIQVFARLDDLATDQDSGCTFDVTFTGEQV